MKSIYLILFSLLLSFQVQASTCSSWSYKQADIISAHASSSHLNPQPFSETPPVNTLITHNKNVRAQSKNMSCTNSKVYAELLSDNYSRFNGSTGTQLVNSLETAQYFEFEHEHFYFDFNTNKIVTTGDTSYFRVLKCSWADWIGPKFNYHFKVQKQLTGRINASRTIDLTYASEVAHYFWWHFTRSQGIPLTFVDYCETESSNAYTIKYLEVKTTTAQWGTTYFDVLEKSYEINKTNGEIRFQLDIIDSFKN